MVKFSIVVPTYNRKEKLMQCLASLSKQCYPKDQYEVIVIDDGSTDGTSEIMTYYFGDSNVRYFYQKNGGCAKARNLGIVMAKGNIIAFTDDDCVVPWGWITALDTAFSEHPEVAGVGGTLIPNNETKSIFAKYDLFLTEKLYKFDNKEYIGSYECQAFGTCNIAYRKTALVDVSGFDENYKYPASEDADLKFRVCKKGYKMMYIPVAIIHYQDYSFRRFIRTAITRGKGEKLFRHIWGSILSTLPAQQRGDKVKFVLDHIVQPKYTLLVLLLLLQRAVINYGKLRAEV